MSKICVTVGRGRHTTMLEEWKAAAEAGADLVELRIDCLRREPDLGRILAHRYTPLIFTVRRGADGGLWRGDEDKRQKLIREAIALGVDYIDLEMDLAPKIPRFGKTQRIVSYHNFKKVPSELPQLVEQMEEMNADIVKFAVLTSTLAEAIHVLKIAKNSEVPTIGIGMSEIGLFTRLLGAKYGAPLTYCNFNPERTFAPGMPHFRDLRDDFAYGRIQNDTEVYAVIGDPIAQTLSPAVHNAVFKQLGLNRTYVPILVPGGTLKASLETLSWLDLKGLSVTIPHKQEIIPLLDKVDETVERTGACNTVAFVDGSKVGYNTDYPAALMTMENALGGLKEDGSTPLADRQALILGAGGVARSVAFGLSRSGAGVWISNRTDARANDLAEQVGCRTVTWAMRASVACDIMVNCTPVGMHPDVDETPMPPAGFRPNVLVFDTVYHPENTMFLKLAREHDCKIATGVEMFAIQAALQSKLFTGHEPPLDSIREVVHRKFSPMRD